MVATEWFGREAFDIEDLHSKELEFEVYINQLKLREIVTNVLIPILTNLLQLNCFLEISVNDEPTFTFRTSESLKSNNVFVRILHSIQNSNLISIGVL
jgi:hypothetical protein